jgi:hypothetical protein
MNHKNKMEPVVNVMDQLVMKYKVEEFLQSIPQLFPVVAIPYDVYIIDHMSNIIKSRILREMLHIICPAEFNVLGNNGGDVIRSSPEVKSLVVIMREVMYDMIRRNNMGQLRQVLSLC